MAEKMTPKELTEFIVGILDGLADMIETRGIIDINFSTLIEEIEINDPKVAYIAGRPGPHQKWNIEVTWADVAPAGPNETSLGYTGDDLPRTEKEQLVHLQRILCYLLMRAGGQAVITNYSKTDWDNYLLDVHGDKHADRVWVSLTRKEEGKNNGNVSN